jgi:hypothetical protein
VLHLEPAELLSVLKAAKANGSREWAMIVVAYMPFAKQLNAEGIRGRGYLCLPRLRVAFDILPGDLLIADTNHEQHGSISPRTGTRISVVAYLRELG